MYIETGRLIIRAFLPMDANDLQQILGDAEVMRYSEPAYSPERTAAFLRDFCIERRGAMAAEHKASRRVIGYILFHESASGVYEIGWFFHRDFWRQGYAYEACSALIDHTFDQRNAHRIFAETADPARSVGLMKKLRMQPEGVLRRHVQLPSGEWADMHLYGLLNTDRI